MTSFNQFLWHSELRSYSQLHELLYSKGFVYEITAYGNLKNPYLGKRTRVRMNVVSLKMFTLQEIRLLENMLHFHIPDKEYTLFVWRENGVSEIRPKFLSLQARKSGDRSLLSWSHRWNPIPMKQKRLTIGYVARDHLMLDLDGTVVYDYQYLLRRSDKNQVVRRFCRLRRTEIPKKALSESTARKISKLIVSSYPEVGDCLIVESSPNHFHLVFGALMKWEAISKIIDTAYDFGFIEWKFCYYKRLTHNTVVRVNEKIGENGIKDAPTAIFPIEGSTGNRYGIEKYLSFLGFYKPNEVLSN